MRADRFEDRTAENVATAKTSVPTAVAREEATTQSIAKIPMNFKSGTSGQDLGQSCGKG
jgi:type IV secretory pathway VirD2 relaxase